ncbi:MAG: hypothetical protein PHP98_00665 [Kiritimatiellae bacterium]|nr:hypothetical protein [Kiritimatiellia bacterium]
MPSLQYPFLQLRLQDGSFEHRPYTRLPLLIRNPITGQNLSTLGLMDTGADSTLFPVILAHRLGHKLKGTGVKTPFVTSKVTNVTFRVMPSYLAPEMSKAVMKSKKIMLGKDDVGMKHMRGAFRSENLRRFRRICGFPALTHTRVYLPEVFIGQAGDGKLRIGQGLKEIAVFTGYFQGADTARVLKAWF